MVYCPNSFIKHYMLSAFLSTFQIILKNSIMLLTLPPYSPQNTYTDFQTHTHTHTHTHSCLLIESQEKPILISFHFYYLFQRSKHKLSSNQLLGVRTGRNIRNYIIQFLILSVRKLKSRVINQSFTQPWNHHTKDGIHITHLPKCFPLYHYSKRSLCYRMCIETT